MLGGSRITGDRWMKERKGQSTALLLTYICLFVVLDEFSELKVSSDDGNLDTETGRDKRVKQKHWNSRTSQYVQNTSFMKIHLTHHYTLTAHPSACLATVYM